MAICPTPDFSDLCGMPQHQLGSTSDYTPGKWMMSILTPTGGLPDYAHSRACLEKLVESMPVRRAFHVILAQCTPFQNDCQHGTYHTMGGPASYKLIENPISL